jgi:hypothetical protein
MSLESLLPDSLRHTADLAAQFVLDHPETFQEFIDASLAQEYPISMRASRVVYLCSVSSPELIRPWLQEILGSLPFLTDRSVIRNFLHIFDNFIPELSEDNLGLLLSYCFDNMEKPSGSIAIRAYSLKLLYLISQRIPDIKPEVLSIMRHHYPESEPAIQAQAIQIIRKLEREVIRGYSADD